MLLFPAIDLLGGKAVRLLRGDYSQVTVYSNDPASIACDFANAGAGYIHIVDLEGAKSADTPNLETVLSIKKASGLFCEIGGGIRSMNVISRYLESGIDRVILGTSAVMDEDLLLHAIHEYGERIAVGVDIRNKCVAIKGWTETTSVDVFDFCSRLCEIGVKTVICTDISKDGAMQGTNRDLYRQLTERYPIDFTASGGISDLEDIRALRKMNLYGAIIGKAYYSGAIDLRTALEAAK